MDTCPMNDLNDLNSNFHLKHRAGPSCCANCPSGMRRFHCAPRRLRQYHWNGHVHTLRDFDRICGQERIVVMDIPIPTEHLYGVYTRRGGRPVIVFNQGVAGLLRAFTAFHELGHHLLGHVPRRSDVISLVHGSSGKCGLQRSECEADTVACCFLIPRPLVDQFSDEQLVRQGYPCALVEYRRSRLRSIGL